MGIARILLLSVSLGLAMPAEAPRPRPPESAQAQPNRTHPFAIGERLVYRVRWDPPWYLIFLPTMEAGEAELQLLGDAEYKNKKAWKISLKAHSSGMLVRLSGMKIEDEFVFLTEPETLCSLCVDQKIREGKRKRQINIDYLRDANQLHIRELDEAVAPPIIKKDEIKNNIPSCIQDPFSALYSFRMSELRLHQTQVFVVGHNDKVKEIRVHVEKQENIDTALGKIAAWNISTSALMGGLFKDGGQFRLWLSADERKLPLQFEVKVGLGRVFGRLKSVEN